MRDSFQHEPAGFPDRRGRWGLLPAIVIAVLIVLPIRFFVVQPFFVRGASMEPTFRDGEYLLVDELSYRIGNPRRGDVVVFRFPLQQNQFFIKRIIGLPGETVEILGDGRVRITSDQFPSGAIVDEKGFVGEGSAARSSATLGPAEYFVLGDNREASSDSRRWGPLLRSLIVGRAWLRLWPVARAEVLTN